MTMRIGSLCSGAGGLDMAVEQVFGARTVWHCELPVLTDKKGRTRHNAAVDVLAHRWPGVPNLGDLNPAFSEWMMGWPASWVTDVPGISRNDQLRIIGNGVVPQCAAAALRWLLSIEQAA